jgi:hypothetical protein
MIRGLVRAMYARTVSPVDRVPETTPASPSGPAVTPVVDLAV